MNQLSTETRAAIVRCLVEGNSIRATSRLTGVCKEAIMRLLCLLGAACREFQNQMVLKLKSKRIQCDEIWSFVGCKEYTLMPEERGRGRGDCWTWTALDPDTKLIVAWRVGLRTQADAILFMEDIAARVIDRIQITTDAFNCYKPAIDAVFGAKVDYAHAIKKYARPTLESRIEARYSPSRCKEVQKKPIFGDPNPRHITTSHNERNNLTMRMGMRRFTRLTNAFSKKIENHGHAVSLHMMHYNFCRVHQTLRVTPAMEAGIASHVWSIDEVIMLLADSISQTNAA